MIHDNQSDGPHVIEDLRALLQQLPNVEAEAPRFQRPSTEWGSDPGFDAQIKISVAGRPLILFIEAKKSVFPRDVREALWHIKRWSSQAPPGESQAIPVIAAESISAGAKDLLRSEHVGYYDSSGSLFLPAEGVYVYLDRPSTRAVAKSNRSLFSSRRSQVVHALLIRSKEWVTVKDLAIEASVSAPTASQVLIALERFDWLATRGSGPNKERRLTEPGSLLDAWAKQFSTAPAPSSRRFYLPSLSSEQILERIDSMCSKRGITYAITQEWAAQLYAPFLSNISQVRCWLPLDRSTQALLDDLQAREVNEGANLSVVETKSRGQFLFRERIRNVWLASPVLVYLDLLSGEGRAKEMAQNLRRERIGF